MPIEYKVGDYGDTVNLKRVHHGDGVTAILYRNIPAEAKTALEFMATTATRLQREKQEYRDAYNAEVKAHNETRCELATKANRVLQRGLALLLSSFEQGIQHNEELQGDIAELRELQREFPFV